MIRSKRCPKCGVTKTVECYYRNALNGDGLYHSCKDCHREIARRSWHRRYPVKAEEIRVKRRAWERAHRDKRIAYCRAYHRRMRIAALDEARMKEER